MMQIELEARAHQRAYDEHVHIFSVPGRDGVYTTRSKSQPYIRYSLFSRDGEVACSCAGFAYRGSCKHAEALKNRLAREAIEADRRQHGRRSGNILPWSSSSEAPRLPMAPAESTAEDMMAFAL